MNDFSAQKMKKSKKCKFCDERILLKMKHDVSFLRGFCIPLGEDGKGDIAAIHSVSEAMDGGTMVVDKVDATSPQSSSESTR